MERAIAPRPHGARIKTGATVCFVLPVSLCGNTGEPPGPGTKLEQRSAKRFSTRRRDEIRAKAAPSPRNSPVATEPRFRIFIIEIITVTTRRWCLGGNVRGTDYSVSPQDGPRSKQNYSRCFSRMRESRKTTAAPCARTYVRSSRSRCTIIERDSSPMFRRGLLIRLHTNRYANPGGSRTFQLPIGFGFEGRR